jgi:hypothetical protein
MPGPGEPDVEGTNLGVWAIRTDLPDGRWAYRLATGRWAHRLHYRSFADALGPEDVAALCAVSVTHTGVFPTRYARLWRADAVTEAYEHGDGTASLRTWRPTPVGSVWDGVAAARALPSWAEAAAAFHEATGTPIR